MWACRPRWTAREDGRTGRTACGEGRIGPAAEPGEPTRPTWGAGLAVVLLFAPTLIRGMGDVLACQ
ncbi:hypothetical protein AB0K48_44615, partial [Nonomuraea sp. NPDC055795]